MTFRTRQDQATRAARRAVLLEGFPVLTLGGVSLALGSDPDQSPAHKAWWITTSVLFMLALVWVLVRAFRRADEYQRTIQLESMAVAFAVVLVGLQVGTVLDAADLIRLRPLTQMLFIGGIAVWLLLADLRTRLHR